MIYVIYRPEKKVKKETENHQRNPPGRKIGFMHKRTEKAKKQKEE